MFGNFLVWKQYFIHRKHEDIRNKHILTLLLYKIVNGLTHAYFNSWFNHSWPDNGEIILRNKNNTI
jgi:hypothetical protein